MTAPLFIIGAGGFGREVFSIIEALESSGKGPHPTGFIDDGPSPADLQQVEVLGSRVVASVDDLIRRTKPFSTVLAIGSAAVRETIAGLLAHSPVTFPVLVQPDTTMGCNVRLAEGVVVTAGSRLSTNIQVGKHVHIDQNAVVGHDCNLGDYSRLNPQACVSGAVMIGRGELVGANATILQGLEVGDHAIVGARLRSLPITREVPHMTDLVALVRWLRVCLAETPSLMISVTPKASLVRLLARKARRVRCRHYCMVGRRARS